VRSAIAFADGYLRARRNFTRLRGADLEAYQDRLARSVVAHAVRLAPYYREHFAGHDLRAWRALPQSDKRTLMPRAGEANTCGISRDEAVEAALTAERTRDFTPTVRGVTVGLSSGTSGHRSLFLATRSEQARWVGTILARLLPPYRARGFRITLFSLSGSNLYDDLRGRWIRFAHLDVAMPMDDAARLLQRDPPDLLCGPPLYLRALAERQRAGALRISPERLITVADVLEPHVRRELVAAFGCPVGQVYQCSEGLVALSCPADGLHLQEDLTAVELEPIGHETDGRYTPVITDLWHRSFPIIRYRLGDVVTLAPGQCACGSAFRRLAAVEGRSDDVCEFADVRGAMRLVFPATIRQMVLLAGDDIVDFDAEQSRPSQLRVRVLVAAGASAPDVVARVQASLDAGLAAQGIVDASVEVVADAPRVPGLKRRRIRRVRSTADEVAHGR
jgi:putative adenylate-forming enzyme